MFCGPHFSFPCRECEVGANEMQWVAEHFAGLVQRCRGRPGNLVYVNLYHLDTGGEGTASALGHRIARIKLLIVQIAELRDINSAQSCCRAIAGRARSESPQMSCCKLQHFLLLNPQVKNLTLRSAFRLCNSVVGPWGICEKPNSCSVGAHHPACGAQSR